MNNPLNGFSAPNLFENSINNVSTPFDNYGVSDQFSMELAKIQRLLALQEQNQTTKQTKPIMETEKTIPDSVNKLISQTNSTPLSQTNFIKTPESTAFNTSITNYIDITHIENIISQFFEELNQTSKNNFKRKTKALFETLTRIMDTPYNDSQKDIHTNIKDKFTTELSNNFNSIKSLSVEKKDNNEINLRIHHVITTFESLFPELKSLLTSPKN